MRTMLRLFALLLIPGVLLAQSGKVTGKVIDRESKEPLIGATVLLEGTNLGGTTNVDGMFTVLSVPPGTYTLKASYVGYQTITVSNVRVSGGYTTEQNFDLPSSAVQVPTVEIVAERPLIVKDYTNTVRTQSADEINELPIRGTANVVGLQASVVKDESSNLLFIRGGRSEEVAYVIDGVTVNNPLSGNASASFTAFNQNSIEELQVQTGGFNAEYGSAMSGLINLTSKSGGARWTGSAEVSSDNWRNADVGGTNSFGQTVANLSIGGPIIPESNKLTLFASGERQYLRDNDPRAIGGLKENTATKSWNVNGNINVRPTETFGIKLGGMWYGRDGYNWDNFRRWFNADHQQRFDNTTYSLYGKVTHNLDASTFYEVQLGYFNERLASGDGVWFDDLLSYGDTLKNPLLASQANNPGAIYSVVAAPGTVFDRYTKSSSQQYSIKADLSRQQGTHLLKGGFEYRTYKLRWYTLNPMGLALGGTGADAGWEGYRNNNVEYYGYDYTGQSEYNGDANNFGDFFGDANGDGVPDRLEGPKTPKYLAAYVQDKVELSDLILNIGIRMDRFDANEYVPKDPLNPFGARGTPGGGTFDANDWTPSTPTTTVSPRFGFSFPITDRAVFHAQYGTFLQMPPFQYVLISKTWADRVMGDSPFSVRIPNPDLKPERTVSYEIGFRQLLSDNAALSITGFYKEIKDLIQARNFGIGTTPAYPNGYESYENVDFGTVKGFDMIFELRRTKNLAVTFNYTLGFANGTGSGPQTQSRLTWIQTVNPKFVAPLDFDRRHSGSVNLDYRLGASDGPKVGSSTPFERMGLNLLFTFNSGVPYTRSVIYNPFFGGVTEIPPTGAINGAYTPWNFRFDLRLDKGFTLGGLNLTASLNVLNLLDTKNVFGIGYPSIGAPAVSGSAGIYRGTGEPDNTGWLSTKEGQEWAAVNGPEAVDLYEKRQHDPANYGIPRQIRLGLRLEY